MRKILSIVLLAFVLNSCGNDKTRTSTTYKNLDVEVNEYMYNGHKYQMHRIYDGKTMYRERCGVVHAPDCPCYKDSVK